MALRELESFVHVLPVIVQFIIVGKLGGKILKRHFARLEHSLLSVIYVFSENSQKQGRLLGVENLMCGLFHRRGDLLRNCLILDE